MSDQYVNLNNKSNRSAAYSAVLEKIGKDKICPFCEEHLYGVHPNPIEAKMYWFVTNNAYPYGPKKEHVLLIHKSHISHISELSKEAWSELQGIINEESAKRKITGATFMMRFGETKYTGSTVTHLHAHLFQSDPDHSDYDQTKGVLTRVG